ncbi:uncharacterized protein LOC131650418 [Vicia villosa]|uniref:uncharacterized protein LOC131650418 n=1 Tax=Vicia villosa TaxID=3911 RepID=UPI00273B5D5A|nr:uncharacterized protein LOC131650418 [Vicia villosa]
MIIPALNCEFTRRMCFSPPLGFRLPSNVEIIYWIGMILRGGNMLVTQLQITSMWKVWNVRNNCVFNRTLEDPAKVAMDTAEVIKEFNYANPDLAKKKMATDEADYHSPAGGVTIVQVDAGCYDNGVMAMGCVVKPDGNGVVMSACRREQVLVNPNVAEAMAIRWALSLMQAIHLDNAVLQSDALNVIDSIYGLNYIADLDPIVADCKHLITCFRNVSVSFIGRRGNVDAHHMVGVGRTLGNKTWLGCIPNLYSSPSCINSVVAPLS